MLFYYYNRYYGIYTSLSPALTTDYQHLTVERRLLNLHLIIFCPALNGSAPLIGIFILDNVIFEQQVLVFNFFAV